MNGYGNINGQIFVYLSYVIVALSLFIYVFSAFLSRKKAIKSLAEEGFLKIEENES